MNERERNEERGNKLLIIKKAHTIIPKRQGREIEGAIA